MLFAEQRFRLLIVLRNYEINFCWNLTYIYYFKSDLSYASQEILPPLSPLLYGYSYTVYKSKRISLLVILKTVLRIMSIYSGNFIISICTMTGEGAPETQLKINIRVLSHYKALIICLIPLIPSKITSEITLQTIDYWIVWFLLEMQGVIAFLINTTNKSK